MYNDNRLFEIENCKDHYEMYLEIDDNTGSEIFVSYKNGDTLCIATLPKDALDAITKDIKLGLNKVLSKNC